MIQPERFDGLAKMTLIGNRFAETVGFEVSQGDRLSAVSIISADS
jgi:hypothetical protein